MGLVLSFTTWFMLNKSTALSARRSRALQPVALSAVHVKTMSKASTSSQMKITTQARRDWEAVVGRGTPKNTVEVAAEAKVAVETDLVNDARAGQAEKGEEGGAALPARPLGGSSSAEVVEPLKL
jgi:hypothetical protein